MGKNGKGFLVRATTAVVLAAVVIAGVVLSKWGFLALAVAVCVGTLREFFMLAKNKGAEPLSWYATVVGAVTVALVFATAQCGMDSRLLALLIPLGAAIFVAELYRRKENPLVNISVAFGGLAYIALPLSLLAVMAGWGGEYNPWFILAVIGIVVVNDTFAYLTGVTIGKHRMFERISPKKSWEGFAGGLVFSVGAAVLFGHLLGGDLLVWGGAGAVTVAGAVFGDLVESLFKRSAGVKDSGNVLPGHGGFLDRLDAILFAIPLIFVYFIIFVR